MQDEKGSVSRIECEIEVRGKGRASLFLYRHLAPLTVSSILRQMPIESRVSVQERLVCIFTKVRVGLEKPRTSFTAGDVAFLPLNSLLCFFLGNADSGRPLNYVGKLEKGIEQLSFVRPGDVIVVRKVHDKE